MTSARRIAAVAGLAGAFALAARPASAHLMAAGNGTVNVVGSSLYTVLSVPASALRDADDDHDGLLDLGELGRHQASLEAEIDRRLVLLDGATPARTVRVDLLLSPEHGAATDRAAHVVVLKHAELDRPPADLRVHCDLFGRSPSEQSFSITATRHPASGTETETATLTPGAAEHAFFPLPAPAATVARAPSGERAPWGIAAVGAVFLVALIAAGTSERVRSGAGAA